MAEGRRSGSKSGNADGGEGTRATLIDSARKEFGARGFAATSVDDIVRRSGVTKGAFYHHFDGKKELFRQVFRQVKKELSRAAFVTHERHVPFADPREDPDRLERFVNRTDAGVWRDLEACCRRYVELHTAPAMRRIALTDARWVLAWDEREAIEREYGTVLLRADLRRARSRGLVAPDVPIRETAVLLAGALNEACMWVAHQSERDREAGLDLAMSVIGRFLTGLRSRGFDQFPAGDGAPETD